MVARRIAPLILVLALASAARAVEPAAPGLGYDHPLTGRVWDVAQDRFVTLDALATAVSGARFVLLGERHDHPEHHQFQAWLLRRMVDAGRRPAVAFEMLDTTQAPALARHLAAAPRDAAGLGEAVGWRAAGWPAWRLYQPIAETALAAGLPIVAANLPTTAARAVAHGDLSALDPALVRRHGLDQPAAEQAALEEEIRSAHCGALPDTLVPGMVTAQRARDAEMAERLVAGQRDGAALIAGAGHVRTDRGVPRVLALLVPGARVVSVAFMEVADGWTRPSDYAARFGSGARLPFDHIWFTARADNVDPCARLRRRTPADTD
ncbi:MAG TPA: ChaN family lipoprotein [Methylomirabilota bacterium]